MRLAGLWRRMVLDERVGKIPEDFRLGPERLACRKRPAALVPRIELAVSKLLKLIRLTRTVHHPTFNMLIGQIALEMKQSDDMLSKTGAA
jgi:hypothetical protein